MRSLGSAPARAVQYLLNLCYALDAQLLDADSDTDLTVDKTPIGPLPQEAHFPRSSILQEMRGIA
jgi:hypothetical protein